MLNQPIYTPTSLAEVDAIAENLRGAMKETFSFEIGPKKQQRLREVTCRTLGFSNGLQQVIAGFPEDLSKTEPYPDHLPDVMIMEANALEEIFLHLNVNDMTPLKSGWIKEFTDPGVDCDGMEFEESNNEEIRNRLGMDFTKADRVIMGHYRCDRIFILTPRIDRYGVPEIGVPHNVEKIIRDQFGFECAPDIEDEHHIQDTGDDSGITIYLKLVKKPKS